MKSEEEIKFMIKHIKELTNPNRQKRYSVVKYQLRYWIPALEWVLEKEVE